MQKSLLIAMGLGSLMPLSASAEVTTGSLIEEMIDLERLIEMPAPYFETVQFSSYDRRSDLPNGPGWFANSDGFGNEPIPNFEAVLAEPDDDGVGEYLVCDVTGPGAVVRVWTAKIPGTIRMYLDGADEPVYDGSADTFFRRTYEPYLEESGLDAGVFEGTFQQQDACYLPIPFAERCRIVWRGELSDLHFYHIQLRRYHDPVTVKTFRPSDLKTYADEIRRVAKVLSSPDSEWTYASDRSPQAINVTVQPGEVKELAKRESGGAIERLTLKTEAGEIVPALRQSVLHIEFDGAPWGQVQSPIGDFFGASPGINPFVSLPFTVDPDGTMTCRYVMPFADRCVMKLENLGDQPVTVRGDLLVRDYEWKPDRSMHFRARWRVDHDLVAAGGSRAQDMPYLLAKGAGRYVGTTTMLLNPNDIPHGIGNWWGEGDEKIFVDDDVVPSTFGTGSEDYFNYSWGVPDIFRYPYCGQPRCDGPRTRGFIVNQRWHIIDDLPWREWFAFYMELYHHFRTPGVSYAVIGYHYGKPGMVDDHVAITVEDVRAPAIPGPWMPEAKAGAAGSVFIQAEEMLTSGENPAVDVAERGHQWAGDKLLAWTPKDEDAKLPLRFKIEEAGNYHVQFVFAHTPRSGSVSIEINGEPVPLDGQESLDLHQEYLTLSRVHSAGAIELQAGEVPIVLEYAGDEAASGTEIGLDFVWVQRIEE